MVGEIGSDGRLTPTTWCFELAQLCLDMESGKLLHLPEAGGALDQSDWLVMMLRTAWRVWYIHEFKVERKLEITSDDTEFTRWFIPEGWRPGDGR